MVEAHGNLAIVLERLGRNDEALAHYRETVRLAPGDVRARLNLASVLEGAGMRDEARLHYQEALRLKPGAPEAVEGLARIDGARGSAAPGAQGAALHGQRVSNAVPSRSRLGRVSARRAGSS
jgi:Flp pilus assembly protein TadD